MSHFKLHLLFQLLVVLWQGQTCFFPLQSTKVSYLLFQRENNHFKRTSSLDYSGLYTVYQSGKVHFTKYLKCFQTNSSTFKHNVPSAYWGEVYCHSGCLIWSQATLFGDAHQDLRGILFDCAKPIHGGPCIRALQEVCPLHSQHRQRALV